MKEKIKNIFSFIFGIIIIVFLTIGIIKLGTFILNALKVLIEKYPTIAVALITGLLAFISGPVGKYLENQYNIKMQIRKEREDVYIEFLDWLIENVLNGEISNNPNIVEELKEKQNKIVIYGSDDVLKAWTKFKSFSMNINQKQLSGDSDEKTKYYLNGFVEIENLILSMRKELGYKNKNIKSYDILNLYINDIDKYINDKTIKN